MHNHPAQLIGAEFRKSQLILVPTDREAGEVEDAQSGCIDIVEVQALRIARDLLADLEEVAPERRYLQALRAFIRRRVGSGRRRVPSFEKRRVRQRWNSLGRRQLRLCAWSEVSEDAVGADLPLQRARALQHGIGASRTPLPRRLQLVRAQAS